MYNIVILNGSPKRDGNTSMLANHFVEGARNAGHMVTHFHLHEMFIHPCNGCMKGGQDEESPCVQIDDMRPIYKAFLNSDMIVLASPMYYWSFSAQLKVAIDRMFAIAELSPNWKSPCKSCALLMAGEEKDISSFEPVKNYYQSLLKNLGWKNYGQVFAAGVINPGDIQGNPALTAAHEMGATLQLL